MDKGGHGIKHVDKITYTLEKAKPDSNKNVLLLKNPQFLPNHTETL